jgi:hypothetical protein
MPLWDRDRPGRLLQRKLSWLALQERAGTPAIP